MPVHEEPGPRGRAWPEEPADSFDDADYAPEGDAYGDDDADDFPWPDEEYEEYVRRWGREPGGSD